MFWNLLFLGIPILLDCEFVHTFSCHFLKIQDGANFYFLYVHHCVTQTPILVYCGMMEKEEEEEEEYGEEEEDEDELLTYDQ